MTEAKQTRPPSQPWRQDKAILARIAEVERRLAARESVPSIALALGIGERTVRLDRQRGTALFRERTGDTVEEQRADTIRHLEAVIATALGQARFDYEASRAILFGTSAHGLEGEVLSLRWSGRGRSPEYKGSPAAALAVARSALMDIAKLRGLVVDKVSPTDAEGKTLDLASLVALARQNQATE